jgi:hypothetical protein
MHRLPRLCARSTELRTTNREPARKATHSEESEEGERRCWRNITYGSTSFAWQAHGTYAPFWKHGLWRLPRTGQTPRRCLPQARGAVPSSAAALPRPSPSNLPLASSIQHPASYRVLAILLAQHVRVLRRPGATTCLSQAQRQDHLRKLELYVSLPQHRKPRITEVTYTCHSGSRCHSAFTRCCSCRAACFGWGHPKLADGATQTAGRVSESSPLQQFVSSRHRAGVYGTAYERCGVS